MRATTFQAGLPCRSCGIAIRVGDDLNGRERHNDCWAARDREARESVSKPVVTTPVVTTQPVVRTYTACRRCGGPLSITSSPVCDDCR